MNIQRFFRKVPSPTESAGKENAGNNNNANNKDHHAGSGGSHAVKASHPPEEEPPAKRSRRSSVGGTEEQQQQASRPTSNNNNRTAFFDLTEPENATAGPDKQHEKQQEAKQEQAQQQHPVAEVPASEGQAQLQHQAGSERGTGEGTGVSGVTGEEQRQQVSGFGCSNASAEQGPSDQDAAASETKGATQNRPQLLADVQQQIQDIRAALRQELLLPCSLQPSEPGTESTETQQDCTTGEPLPLHEVAAYVEGRRCSLSALVEQLTAIQQRRQHPQSQVADPQGPATAQAGSGEGAVAGSSSSSGSAVEAASRLRTQLVDMAARKSYASKDTAHGGLLDTAEDTDPDALWFWELREPKKALAPQPSAAAAGTAQATQAAAGGPVKGTSLPRNSAAATNKKLTDLYRRRRKDLHDRLTTASGLVALLQKALECAEAAAPAQATTPSQAAPASAPEGDAADKKSGKGGKKAAGSGAGGGKGKGVSKALEEKLSKAVLKLEKLPGVNQIEMALESGLGEVGSKDSAAVRKAERMKAAQQDAAQREQERAAAAAGKEEEKRVKAAEKNAKAAGFSNVKELQKSKQVFKSFFKPGPASQTPGPNPLSRVLHSALNASPSAGQHVPAAGKPSPAHLPNQAHDGSTGQTNGVACLTEGQGPPHAGNEGTAALVSPAGQGAAAAVAVSVSVLPPCPSLPPHCNVGASYGEVLDARRSELDRLHAAGLPDEGLPALRESLIAGWKHEAATQRMRVPGVPPSWARNPNAPMLTLHERCVAMWGEGYDASAVRTLRKKLIKHHDNVRPAYYGSWRRPSLAVCGRRPFGCDPGLDYEVMSDEEWEEEPEGESLSDDGEDLSGDAGPAGGEDDEEGFVVEDGFLSDDEGAREMDEDAAGDDGCGHTNTNIRPSAPSISSDPLLAALESGIARALRSNRPLIVTRLQPVASTSAVPASAEDANDGVCAAQGTVTPAAHSAQDPEVLLAALSGSILRPDALITPPLERSIYAPRVPTKAAPAPQQPVTDTPSTLPPNSMQQQQPLQQPSLQGAGSAAVACSADPALLHDVLGRMEAAGVQGMGSVVQQVTAAAATGVQPSSGAGGTGGKENRAVGPQSGGKGSGRTATTFPEAAVPALTAFLQSTSERAIVKVVDAFHAAYSSNSLAHLGCTGAPPPKKAIKEKIKQLSTYQGSTHRWVLNATIASPAGVPALSPTLAQSTQPLLPGAAPTAIEPTAATHAAPTSSTAPPTQQTLAHCTPTLPAAVREQQLECSRVQATTSAAVLEGQAAQGQQAGAPQAVDEEMPTCGAQPSSLPTAAQPTRQAEGLRDEEPPAKRARVDEAV